MRQFLRDTPQVASFTIVFSVIMAIMIATAIMDGVNYADSDRPVIAEAHTIVPQSLALPAGATGIFTTERFTEWDSASPPQVAWLAYGSPDVANIEILNPAGDPSSARIFVHTNSAATPGTFDFEIVATSKQREWRGELEIQILPCVETIEAGSHQADDEVYTRSGGPTSTVVGLGSPPMVFCTSDIPRQLRLEVQSATDQFGTVLDHFAAEMIFYQIWNWPPDTNTMRLSGHIAPDTAPLVRCKGGVIEWDIAPGVYRLFFPQHQFLQGTTTPWQFYPEVSVAYTLQIEPRTEPGPAACVIGGNDPEG